MGISRRYNYFILIEVLFHNKFKPHIELRAFHETNNSNINYNDNELTFVMHCSENIAIYLFNI